MKSLLIAFTLFTNQNQTPIIKVQGTTCFSKGEQQGGMTKICYYDCLGSPAAITIASTQLCPLTIKR